MVGSFLLNEECIFVAFFVKCLYRSVFAELKAVALGLCLLPVVLCRFERRASA